MVLWRRKSKVWVGRMVHLDYPFLDSKILIWLCVGLGIAFRLKVYLDNRSLWLDEARLSLNIVNKSIYKNNCIVSSILKFTFNFF